MFRSKAIFGICLLLATAPASVAMAQGFDGKAQPAELPPSSYAAKQYVDSRGCAYVRAGVNGAVTWVPRMSAAREVQCGFTPSLAAAVTAEPDATLASAPVAAAPAKPAVPAAIAPRTSRSVAQQPRPAPKRARRPSSGQVVIATPPPAQVVRVAASAGSGGVVKIYPVVRVKPAGPIHVPRGYRPAWNDDRLNPHRGKQTFDGALQTALVWTQTVPRRLVNELGEDVTRTYNYLIYPYTDYHKQKAALAGGKKVVVKAQGSLMVVDRSRLRVSSRTGKLVLDGN